MATENHQPNLEELEELARELVALGALAGPLTTPGGSARGLAFVLRDLTLAQVREILARVDLTLPLSDNGIKTLTRLKDILAENARLQELTVTDSLTGLYNVRHFRERLEVELHRAERTEKSCSVLMIDLDRFKPVNDTHGHQEGDRLLRTAAGLIRTSVRAVDVPVRYGGDEFAVILPEAGTVSAARIAERIRGLFHQDPHTSAYGVTGSFGLATHHYGDHETGEELIGRADEALYEAKKAGGDRVWFFEADRLKEKPTGVTVSERDDLFSALILDNDESSPHPE
ncbi:MAG: GGDEF domain-containing protein [Thermodesulfobacteriota bacterium]